MSFKEKIKKYDKASYGIIVSITLLFIGYLLSYLVKGYSADIPFSRYFRYLYNGSPDRMDILIFSMIPNMFLFYFTNFQWRMYEFTKGLVGITIVLCLIIVFLSA